MLETHLTTTYSATEKRIQKPIPVGKLAVNTLYIHTDLWLIDVFTHDKNCTRASDNAINESILISC